MQPQAAPVSSQRSLARFRKAASRAVGMVERLEDRRMLSISVASPIPNIAVNDGAPSQTIPLAGVFRTTNIVGDVVRFVIEVGGVRSNIDIELFNRATATRSAAPITTANFLSYVNAGRYTNTIFHRALNFTNPAAPAQFLQGGSFIANAATSTLSNVPTTAPINLEFANDRPNVRGTIAMARTAAPNSATSGFFFNTIDNSGVFNAANPYAVFGRVIGNSQAVLDSLSALPRINANFNLAGAGSQQFQGVPVSNVAAGNAFANLVYLRTASVVENARTTFRFDVSSSDSQVASASLNERNELVLAFGTRIGTATISVVAADMTGASVTDTFTVTIGAPAIQLSHENVRINDGQTGVVPLGTAFIGQPVTRAFTLRNVGAGPLTLGDFTLPEGVTLASAPPATIAPGRTGTFVLAFDTAAAGTRAGVVSFASNAGDQSFSFPVSLSVGNSVTVGAGGVRSIVFTDADNTRVSTSLSGPGTATLAFTGSGLSVAVSRGVATVSGAAEVATVTLGGTTSRSTFSMATRGGDQRAAVGSLTSPAPLAAVSMPRINLLDSATLVSGNLALGHLSTATLSLTSPAAVRSVTLGDVTGSTVSFSGVVASLRAGNVAQSMLRSVASLNAVTLGSFVGSQLHVGLAAEGVPDAAADFVTGVQIGSLTIAARTANAFSGADIFATRIGRLSLGQLTAAGGASRIIATGVAQLAGRPEVGRAFSVRNITPATPIDNLLTTAGVPTARLDVNVVA